VKRSQRTHKITYQAKASSEETEWCKVYSLDIQGFICIHSPDVHFFPLGHKHRTADREDQNFFEVELKVDVLLLRMVLDIVTKVLKNVEPFDEAFENSAFLNSS
jgi:hypothetical protein